MENTTVNIVDESIKNFCREISLKFSLNMWDLFAMHKWGDMDPTMFNVLEEDGVLYVYNQGQRIAKINDEWQIIVV